MGSLTSKTVGYGLRKTREYFINDNYTQLSVLFGAVFLQKGSLAHIFFKNERGVAISIYGDRCRAMLENFVRPAVENHPQIWFQQDGTTAHTARVTMALLRDIFENGHHLRDIIFNN